MPAVKGITLPHVAFIENCICILSKSVTILLMGRLLTYVTCKPKAFKTRQPSRSMITLLCVHFIGSSSSRSYNFYLVTKWNAGFNDYNIYAVFWTGIFHSLYLAVAPIAVFFLTLERCLVLTLSLNYEARVKLLIHRLNLTTLFVALTICITFCLLELPLDDDGVTKCGIFTCTLLTFRGFPQLSVKTAFGTANLAGTFLLIWLINRNNQSATNANNRAIRVTILLEVGLCVVPGYCSIIVLLILPGGYSPSAFLGEYPAMLLSVDGMLCSLYFTWLFLYRQTVNCWTSTVTTIMVASAPS